MSDDTRSTGGGVLEPDPDRTPSGSEAEPTPAGVGEQIEVLRAEGSVVLALALPWSESVRSALSHFERTVAPLHLDDEAHRQVGQAAGIAELYDMLDALTLATTEIS